MGQAFCAYFNQGECRSCQWLERDYSSQLAQKEQLIREKLGFFPSFELAPSVASRNQGFRDRAKMSVTGTLDRPVIGLIDRELLACPIHHPRLNELMAAMPAWIREQGIEPYQIRARRGELKGLIAFYSPLSQQMYLRFVVRSKQDVPRIQKGLAALQDRFGFLKCVSANIQPIPHAILEGPEELILSTQSFIEHDLGGVSLRLTPQAFVQTNSQVAAQLYQSAARWIAQAAPTKMLDLFCGQGAFSFFAAASAVGGPPTHKALRILGVEINPQAVEAANETARRSGCAHLEFRCADATGLTDAAGPQGAAGLSGALQAFAPELVLVNPPRRGLGAQGTELVGRIAPAHLIYSSCSIESLAGDLQKLSALGYRSIRRAQLFDMFPHTSHFETLVWLERGR